MAFRKKVLIRTLDRVTHSGYLPPSDLLSPEVTGSIDLLDLSGRLVPLPLAEVRSIAFVRDFNLGDTYDPDSLLRRTFVTRPRTEGLWLRLTFSGGDTLEGLAPTDISLLDNLLTDRGLFLIPPDVRSNTQRLFIPRTAITSLQLLAVIPTPSKPKPVKSALNLTNLQLDLPNLP